VRENAAVEERPELPFDKARHRPALLAGPIEERLELAGDGPVQRGLLGAARNVRGGRPAGSLVDWQRPLHSAEAVRFACPQRLL